MDYESAMLNEIWNHSLGTRVLSLLLSKRRCWYGNFGGLKIGTFIKSESMPSILFWFSARVHFYCVGCLSLGRSSECTTVFDGFNDLQFIDDLLQYAFYLNILHHNYFSFSFNNKEHSVICEDCPAF